jgi:hypothetical protein
MHPIQDLFLESFSYVLQFDMHFYMHSYVDKIFYSCKKWVLQCAFSKIDLRSGQGELKIRECDLTKIAFVLRNGLYVCTMMSFGLTNAPTYYMDLMNLDFMEYLDKFVVVFIDGMLVYSKSEEEHEEHLHLVSQKLQDPRLYVKIRSASFG